MKKVFALVLMTLLVSATALAYDDLITYYGPFTVEPGSFQVGTKLVYLSAGDIIDNDGEKQSLDDNNTNFRLPLYAAYGVIENLTAFVRVPIVSIGTGGESESGIGDIWLGAGYDVMPEGLLKIRGALNLASGDDDKGLGNAGGFGVDIGALTYKRIDSIGIKGQVGVRYAGEDSDSKWKPGIGFYVAGEGGYAFTEDCGALLGLEIMMIGDGQADGNDVDDTASSNYDLNIGLYKILTDTIKFRGDVVYTLGGKRTNADIGVCFGLVYGF